LGFQSLGALSLYLLEAAPGDLPAARAGAVGPLLLVRRCATSEAASWAVYSSLASPPTRGSIPVSGDLRRCYLRRRWALKIAIPSWASCPCLVPPQLGGVDARPPLAPRLSARARAQCLRAGACRLPSRVLYLAASSRYSSPSTGKATLDRGFAPVLDHPRASHRTPKLGSPPARSSL
jgi:hypothetical protein